MSIATDKDLRKIVERLKGVFKGMTEGNITGIYDRSNNATYYADEDGVVELPSLGGGGTVNGKLDFSELSVEPLDGKWPFAVDNALKGRDSVKIKDGEYGTQIYGDGGKPEPVVGDAEAGQLNAHPYVIETEDLARWSGKVGTQTVVDSAITGTIRREDAYEKTSNNVYSRVDLSTYDKAEYGSKSTISNVLVLQRKCDSERGKKFDLIVSQPYEESTYEDEEDIFGLGNVWTQYTYKFLSENPDGSVYIKWISRKGNDGKIIARVLESTADSSEYAMVVEHGQPFESGNITLHKYNNDTYHKSLIYVGDVVEGRWNAGELHSMKKDVDPLSNDYKDGEYDYTGDLTADGKTKLRGSVEIIDDYDSENIKPVESYELTTESATNVITKELNVNIGGEEEPAQISITSKADAEINSTGDINIKAEGKIDVSVDGDINYDYTGKKITKGPSEIAVHESGEENEADFNNVIIENTQIGTDEDKRDLKVNGTVYADELTAGKINGVEEGEDENTVSKVVINGQVAITDNTAIDGTLTVGNNTTINGSLDLDSGDLTIKGDGNIEIVGKGGITINDGDLHIKGNIVQEGEVYETHAEQLYTTKNHIVLRESAVVGLFEDESSGIIVSKYDGENNIHLCVDKTGYARIGEADDEGGAHDVEYEYEFTDTGIFKRDDKYWDGNNKESEEFNVEHVFNIPAEAYDIEYEDNSNPDYVPPVQDETPKCEKVGNIGDIYEELDPEHRYVPAHSISFFFDFENSTPNYDWVEEDGDDPAHYQRSGTVKWLKQNDDYIAITRLEKTDDGILINKSALVDENTMLYDGVEIRGTGDKRYFLLTDYDNLINDSKKHITTIELSKSLYVVSWSDGTQSVEVSTTLLYHMVAPEIIEFIGEPVNVTVKYKLKESSLQRLLTIEPNPQPDSLLYYDDVSKQARTLQSPEGETIPLVPVLEKGKIAYRKYKQDVNVSFDVSVSQIAFDAAHPIDEVYTQYPFQKSPEEIYNKNGVHSVWERIREYDGAFFRAEGGNADEFRSKQNSPTLTKLYPVEAPHILIYLNYAIDAVTITPQLWENVGYDWRKSPLIANTWNYGDYIIDYIEYDSENEAPANYTIRFKSGRTATVPSTTVLMNYNIQIGTIAQVMANNWKAVYENEFTVYPGNTGDEIASNTSAATPSDAQRIKYLKPYGYPTLPYVIEKRNDNNIVQYNARTQLCYDKNVNMGHMEGQFTKWKTETKPLDIPYANSPNQEDDGFGNPIVFSMANAASPTDAQIIDKIEKLAEQDYYNVVFRDGHSTHYVGTTAYYVVQQGLRATTGGQIRDIFDHWKPATITHKYYTLPETDEYCFVYGDVKGTAPTDAQIITRIDVDATTDDFTLYTFKNGTSVWYTWNNAWVYKKNKETGVNQNYWVTGTLRDGVYWPKKTLDVDLYIPNEYITENEDGSQTRDFVLSVASAAAPTEAQELTQVIFDMSEEAISIKYKREHPDAVTGTVYKKIIETLKNGTTTRDTYVNYTNFPANSWTAVYYNKNKLWGSVNCVKLAWENKPYDYFDPIQGETIQKDSYECNRQMYYNGHSVQSIRNTGVKDTGEKQWAIRYYNKDANAYEIFVIASDVAQFALTDDSGEIYNPTLQAIWYNCHKETVPVKLYKAPERGDSLSGTNTYTHYLWSLGNQNNYYTGEADDNWYTTRLDSGGTIPYLCVDCYFDIPNGNGYYAYMRVDGYIYLSNNEFLSSLYQVGNYAHGNYAGIKGRDEYLEEHEEEVTIMLPPELGRDGQPYIASNASAAAPNINQEIEYVRTYHNWSGQGYMILRLKNGFDYRIAIGGAGYDRNITSWSPLSTFFIWPEIYEDIAYYYPPEVDWRGDEYVASIASSAAPTDAQRIVKIDPLEGSINYNVYFADGHSAVYAQTQAIYDKNLYYTTIWGIVKAYDNVFGVTPTWYSEPPEEYVVSSASAAEPTAAQHIVRTRWVENSTNIVRIFEDGHTDQVAWDKATLYDRTTSILGVNLSLKQNWDQTPVYWQRESLPNVEGIFRRSNVEWITSASNGAFTNNGGSANKLSNYSAGLNTSTYHVNMRASNWTKVYESRSEVAPANFTIRIWKRVK